jgi:SAM-dependent methyltransferase
MSATELAPAKAAAHTRAATAATTCEWDGYIATDFRFASFPAGARVLDVGFGHGEQMKRVADAGGRAFGVEYDGSLATKGHTAGLCVCRAAAERLPFAPASFDGLICKVVMPYTDEARAVREIGRVLRPGGVAQVSYHGLGYSLRYLLTDPNWKRRVYGARTIANTIVYRASGRRLPGFWGDTIYQSPSRLLAYYRRSGLELVDAHPSGRFAGAPVFIYHTLRKS